MHITRRITSCLLILLISACNLSSTRFDSAETVPIPDKSQTSSLITKNIVVNSKVKVDKEIKKQPPNNNKHTNLWFLIKDDLQFNSNINQRSVKEMIEWFSRHQKYLDRVAERAEPYLFYIISKLKERGMPLDLALLPIVESAYKPFAYSPSHASGIWQFIPATGKRFGMKQNWWYDGRRDIIASTDGALDYLQYLNKRFNGDWFHALAAYNAGEGNVEKAIKKNKKAGKKTDFWSLPLPRETRSYVPNLLALTEVLRNNVKYNINFKKILNKQYFEKVNVGSQIDLSTVSELSGLSMDEVYNLNPAFNRWATDPKGPHRLLIPLSKVNEFKQKLAVLPESERITWKQHKISDGESLSHIALHHHTDVTTLKNINQLKNSRIRAGHFLLIPTAKENSKFYTLSEDVRKFNNLKSNIDGKRNIYNIKHGDNLWEISRRYDVKVSQLRQWNNIPKKHLLKPGQKLIIWIKQHRNKRSQIKETTKKNSSDTYIVEQGDSLWLIARKHDIHITDLLNWNKIKREKHLQPGQSLIVRQTITDA